MRDTLDEIWSTMRQNKLRTSLTGFAVAWGIFMIIVMLGAGNGVLNALMSNQGELQNSMSMYAGWTSKPYAGYQQWRYIPFDQKDLANLKSGEFGEKVEEISPYLRQSDTLYYKDIKLSVELTAVNPIFQKIDNIQLYCGRFINENDIKEMRKVVVIGHTDAEKLLPKGADYKTVLGENVKVGPFLYKVIGVYKSIEGNNWSQPYTPYSTLAILYKKDNNIGQLSFSFHDIDTEEDSKKFEEAYTKVHNAYHNAAPDDNRTVYYHNNLVQSRKMGAVIGYIKLALWVLGCFSLLSGIVGVSNIMLISVKERTHEFGIRKAIGAKPWSVLRLIIVESVIITAFFGYVGLVLGMGACELMDFLWGEAPMDLGIAQITMFVNPGVDISVAVTATIIMIVAGTIAGMVPAWKASKVKPIEALRAE